ncbi:unnamed protein product [Rotaria sp. Silwood1]|nr:unnamed protein product [Rotaria sp. Silwood1]
MNDMITRIDADLSQPNKETMKYSLSDSLFIYESVSNAVEKLDHPLIVFAYETVDNECITFVLHYAGELFEDDTINDLLDVTNELLIQIANNQITLMAELNFLPIKQLNKINQWNNTDKEFPLNKKQATLHQLFEEEAEKSPDKVAVIYEDVQLTYKELNEKSNQLAHYLRSISNIRPDDLIALLLDKSELMIISILAVWKSGAAYVPIDPSYPDERIQFILQDTKAKIIIANKKYIIRLDPYDLVKIEIESISTTVNDNRNNENVQPICSSDNLAYVTYTSGTTGKPKGVMKEHKSVINVVIDLTEKYNLSASEQNVEKIVLFSQYVFEPFIRQFLMALLNSHALIIIKQDDIHDSNRFDLFSNTYKISYLNGTTSILQGYDYTNSKSLKKLIFAGEELTENCFNKLRKTFKETIINEYGPTESALVSTMKMFDLNEKRINRSIGKPLMNVKCYVLGEKLKQLPIGAIGELYIGGIGVARGYLNRPELTNERFLSNPFQTEEEKKEGKNARIYKTGDLVRWLPDGEIEYLGRNDFQVKIRGIRIELGEIETILSSYQGVKQSVVLAKDYKNKNTDTSSTKYLVGYYLSDNDIIESDLKQFMQMKLPVYMIPNRLVRIKKIPVTVNGKLDARALPDIDFSIDEENYIAPRNELEMELCKLWSNLLGIEKIGIMDDFFRLGGDSISALQIVGRLRETYGLSVSVKDIFVFNTIEKLYDNKLKTQLIYSNDVNQSLNTTELAESKQENSSHSLLPIQEYFFKKTNFVHNHLNQYVIFSIAQFDENKFKDCLAKLIEYHEAFRVRFKKHDGNKYSQYYETNIDSKEINLVRIKNSKSIEINFETELNNLLNKNMDIENGPMYMVGYTYDHGDNGSVKVWFFVHHLIADWTSCRIISEELQRLYTGSDFGNYPLAAVAYETVKNECITFVLHYAGELFEDDTINDLLDVTNELLIQIANNQITLMAELNFLPIKQLNKINQWNNTDKEFPLNKKQATLHQLFEEEAEKSPDKVAVIYEDVQLTYKELNEKSNQLAHYLRSISNIRPDDLIALLLDKSELMIISILAVWKSGAAYVPIDPSYPDERIQFILQDTKAKIIIANKKYIIRLDPYDLVKIEIESISTTVNDNRNNENVQPICSSNNLAYVIYTSGTTGKPKGVVIEHTGVINLKIALTELFQLKSRAESVLSFSNYVFDHFVEQMTYALLNSQVLVILNDAMRVDKPRLYQYLNKHKVTYLSGTPSVLQEYDYEQLSHIIRIDAVGEDFSEIIFNKIRSKFNGLIINGYGPTEISITSHKKLYYIHEKRINKSIGKQIANTSCYVLDKNLKQLPIGAIGELYIGGIGVARGYLNRPELTNERFLSNPFQTEEEKKEGKNARIYKTGDLVRWLPDGEIEYLGRNDFQVKIRGIRIELGEIEAVLSSYQGVKQAVVIAKDAKTTDVEGRRGKHLLGYFVSEDNLIESDIKQYMQTKLPDYMIPNRLVRIEKIPVNINGKLDSRALPEVNFTKYDQNELGPPRNDLEAKIAQIWSELLGIPVENIGIHDDFFSLGGDSILVIKLSLMLSNSLSVKLTVSAIFQNKTIAKLASYILHGLDSTAGENDRIVRISDNYSTHPNYALSFAQERLLFMNEFNAENDANAYNIPIYIKFVNNNVRRDVLCQSLLAILHRHEILRTLIREDKFGIVSQHLLNKTEVNSLFKVNEVYADNKEQLDAELIKLAKYVFNLRKELPINVTFYEMKNEDGYDTTLYMGILIHHICFDGWSWTIFCKDLQMFYDYFERTANNSSSDASPSLTLNLPPLHVQYKDFAAWQRNYLSGKRLNSLLEFWRHKLDGFETLNLITDCSIRPLNYDYSGNEIIFELNEQSTTALKQLAMKLNVSLFSLLLSAYTLMLSNYANQQDIVIGTPVVNRNQPELENLIGFFVNMLVLRIKIDGQDRIIDYIRKVSNEVISAQIHQDMPFERLVKELQIENDSSRHPIVQVVFLMNNQFEVRRSDTHSHMKVVKSIEMSEYLPNHINFKTAKYDISTSINEYDICLRGHFNFATKLFHESTIHNFIDSFIHILSQFSRLNETCKVMDIDCINSVQYNQVQKWNHTDIEDLSALNKQTTLQKVFEEEAKKSPEKIAVVYEDVQFTYKELNQRANQLAHYLQSISNICPDDLIALLLDKSELIIISILAVWKSGAAYVPIDPSYPDERIQFILQDTKAKIIIANKKYITRLNSYDLIKIEIDCPQVNQLLNKHSMFVNPDSNINEHNLAYVIYTSGTTGKPKGVLIEHGSVVSFKNDITSQYFDNNDDGATPQAILFFSNYVFDFSIEQFSLSILNSKTLIILSNTFTIDDNFYSYLNKNRLTYLSGTPTQLQQINFKELKYLKILTIAGEALTEKLFEKIRQEYKGKIINAYGVTETTVYNMVYTYENEMEYKNSIGTLLSNTKRFVLNKNMQMLPVHAVGELYLTGNCMSRGYLNRPELTAERFLPNPFQTEEEKKEGKNARIYKTGDLVRWLPDGEIEYLGRNDFQIKIRGLRIELGEIETVLSLYQGVKQSVVLAKDHKNKNTDTSSTKYLLGYFVSDNDIDECDLKQFMHSKLPNYMIPNRLIRIEKIPVTINGKLDTRALPDIDFSIDEKNYVAPRNELEMKLCQLWSDWFGTEKIGIMDDFFRLGGDTHSGAWSDDL